VSGGKKIAGELIVARGDASPILDAAEEVLDLVSPSVKTLGTIGFLGGIAAIGNDRQGPFISDLLAHFLAVVGLVRRDSEWRFRSVQHVFDDLAVMDLSACQSEVQRPAFAVDNGVDFCGPAATADADRLIFLPPFAPLAARWAFTIVLSIR
jgi:hypothetical protein